MKIKARCNRCNWIQTVSTFPSWNKTRLFALEFSTLSGKGLILINIIDWRLFAPLHAPFILNYWRHAELTRRVSGTSCLWDGFCSSLTQVPCHQVGIVEVFHSQPDDVDELFDDLHELHWPWVNLGKGNHEKQKEREVEHVTKFWQMDFKHWHNVTLNGFVIQLNVMVWN